MKKLFFLVLVAIMFAFGLSACNSFSIVPDSEQDNSGDTPKTPDPAAVHEHTYSGQWTYDAANHWHKATCSA